MFFRDYKCVPCQKNYTHVFIIYFRTIYTNIGNRYVFYYHIIWAPLYYEYNTHNLQFKVEIYILFVI